MEYTIVFNDTLDSVAKVTAMDREEGWQKYIDAHPEFECSTLDEFILKQPMLAASLLICPVH